MCKCRSHGTFPLFGLQSSHLNICYYHQDLHRRPLRPGSRPEFYGDRRALLLIGAWPLPRRPGIGHALKRHPFSGLVDSADGPDGEPAGRRPVVPKHAEMARAGFHDRGDDVSTGVSKARAWAATTIRVGPRLEPIGGPALAVPHLTGSFSSFPSGTCSLSVSRPYLALDGIYRPIRAAFPNNQTRRHRVVVRQGPATTGLSPSPAPLSRGLGPGPPLRTLLQTTIRTPRATDSQAGLFPVRSPLLKESLHVSAAHAQRTGVQQQTTTFSFRFLGVIHAGGCSFCHGDTGSHVTGTGRGQGAMKRPHPLPLMFDTRSRVVLLGRFRQ
ncbi:hypothetical protein V6N13_023038 [Hibiscus sabdariffa]